MLKNLKAGIIERLLLNLEFYEAGANTCFTFLFEN